MEALNQYRIETRILLHWIVFTYRTVYRKEMKTPFAAAVRTAVESIKAVGQVLKEAESRCIPEALIGMNAATASGLYLKQLLQ